MEPFAAGHGRTGGRALRRLAALSLGVLALAAYGVLAPRVGPAEDAAILYLYSENLADTGVISYCAGDAPSEGATDFLWMLALAGLYRLGLATHHAALLLSLGAHVATALVAARLARASGRPAPAGAVEACVALGLFLAPAIVAALAGFSVLVFGLGVLACALFLIERRPTALCAAALATSLVRPDGVLFVAPLLAAAWLLEPGRRGAVARRALLVFALPLCAYFAWRAWYFEHWLPLPFYVKGGGLGLGERLARAARLARMGPLVAVVPVLAWCAWRLRARPAGERARLAAALLATVLVPALAYSSVALTQNVGLRFQYPMLLCGLVLPLALGGEPRRGTHLALAALGLVLIAPTTARCAASFLLMPLQSTPAIARELAGLECARTMAVTEAGWLPYYSRWRCIDLWGLNTPETARRAVSLALLEREAPDLLALHVAPHVYRDVLSGADAPVEATEHSWGAMAHNSVLFAVRNDYDALLVPFEHGARAGEPDAPTRVLRSLHPALDLRRGAWLFFVSPRSACRDELRAILVAHGARPAPRTTREALESAAR